MFTVINNFHSCRLKSLGTNTIKGTNSGCVVIFYYLVLSHTLSIYRLDEDIEMEISIVTLLIYPSINTLSVNTTSVHSVMGIVKPCNSINNNIPCPNLT